MRLTFCFLFSILISACYVPNQTVWQDGATNKTLPRSSSSNTTDIGEMPSKPGACYAKCVMPDETIDHLIDVVPVFKGDDNIQDVVLDTVDYEIQRGGTQWIKKKADRNCRSANPDDCLVWCLVETESIIEEYIIVRDTTQTSQFKMTEIFSKTVEKPGGHIAWVEVVCESDITKNLANEIQSFLANENYYTGNITGILGIETKSALKKYQEENGLPVGNLNFETLEAMDISY